MEKLRSAAIVLGAVFAAGQLHAQPVLTDGEVAARTEQLETQVKVDNQQVMHLQASARKEKDVIKLSCINDKMVKLKGESNVFDQARIQLSGSTGLDDRPLAFKAVVDAAGRVHAIRQEAEQCAGKPELDSEFANEVQAPEFQDDPTNGLPFDDNGGTLVEPPGYASPYN